MKIEETDVWTDIAVGVPSNKFFLVRARQGYAAVMLTEASLKGDGGDKYVWYFQSDGSGVFTNNRATNGTGEVFEKYRRVKSKEGGWDLTDEGGVLYIISGPIKVQWSLGRWIHKQSPYGDVEIALTDKSDINEVNYHDKSLIWQKGKKVITMGYAELTWYGPFGVKDLLSQPKHRTDFSRAGVYLWEELDHDRSFVSYIGNANNLWYRQLEHYWYQLGSAYLLHEKYRECGEDWSIDPSKPEVLSILFDLNKYQQLVFPQLVAENFACMHNLKIHLAPCDDTARVERNLIYQLQPCGNSRGKATEPKNPVVFTHQNAQWMSN